jgi:hypothetical protein
MDRFAAFDLTLGVPYREIVGCLLWIVLWVVGPELVCVKDLAKRCNTPTLVDYNEAFKVLKRIYKSRSAVIIFKRGYAGREIVRSQNRPQPESSLLSLVSTGSEMSFASPATHSQADLLLHFTDVRNDVDLPDSVLPTSKRFTMLTYTDASFAVGDSKESVSGYVIFVNGTAIMWGSQRQTTIVDSTCLAEFVAASICCKQLMTVENMFRFLGVLCPKPYPLYTDSQANQSIAMAMNAVKMGQIRHIAIRYHLFRCVALNGDVTLISALRRIWWLIS